MMKSTLSLCRVAAVPSRLSAPAANAGGDTSMAQATSLRARPSGRTDFARDFSPLETSTISSLFLLFRPGGPKQEKKRKVQSARVQGLKSLAKLVGPLGQGRCCPKKLAHPPALCGRAA